MGVADLRSDFPILEQSARGNPLVYLDSAATSQKPIAVLDAIDHYYRTTNANVHRAAHALSEAATAAFEAAREKSRGFVNAAHGHEIVFTRGTTEAINLIAQSYGGSQLQRGDEILISVMEHHSNIVPWQLVAQRTGATLKACDITATGELDLDDFVSKLSDRTRIVALAYVSNALGTINPVAELITKARDVGAVTVIDGAQSAPHLPIDVQAMGCDFFAFSGHKTYGPTGIGVLYGRETLLEMMPPWQGGGEMIETVTIESSTYNRLPFKFEAGTPNIAGAVGLGAAIDYLNAQSADELMAHEDRLLALTTSKLKQIEGIRIVGEAPRKTGVVSFLMESGHPHDVGTLLDQQGIAVRTGHHCTMPLMQRLSVPGTVRASFGLYNCDDDVERLVAGLNKVRTFL
jgi:SufS family cysteine desulfurase